MTKAELIRKLSRKAGIPDAEAKIFFEVFLRRAAGILNPGEAVSIKNFGFFQLRKAKVRNTSAAANDESKNVFYSDVLVYNSQEDADPENDEGLIFNIPSMNEPEYNPIDAYFSLSIGKPVIPLRGVRNSEFFIPPTGNELRRLLETKTENLLAHAEVIKDYTKGSEFLLISSESYNENQYAFNWDELDEVKKETEEILKEIDSIPWDFGEEISRQIEEESILDIGKADDELPELTEENVSWDFGDEYLSAEEFHATEPIENKSVNVTFTEEEEEAEAEKAPVDNSWDLVEQAQDELQEAEQEEPDYTPTIKNYSALTLEQVDEKDDIELEEPSIPEPGENEEISRNFQRVKSLTKVYTKERSSDFIDEVGGLSWNFGEVDTPASGKITGKRDLFKNYDDAPADKNGFVEVKNWRKTYDFTLSDSEQERLNNLINQEPEIDEEPEHDAADSFYKDEPITPEKPAVVVPEPQVRYKPVVPDNDYNSNRRSTPVFFVAITVIVLVGAALFIFLRDGDLLKRGEQKPVAENVVKSSSVVIERNYDIPVTYPYPVDGDNSTGQAVNLPVNNKTEIITQKQKVEVNEENKQPAVSSYSGSSQTAPVNGGTKVRDNLYKTGDTYTLQVSAWQSQDKAANEVQKLKSQGRDAFMEKAVIPGRGTWYRVKIGNIKSEAEADKYINQ